MPSLEPEAKSSGSAAADIVNEVRLAVVMYGGVSLAIYINGVAQELLSLVRATAPAPGDPARVHVPDDQLKGAEAVYRELGRRMMRADGKRPWEDLPAGAPIRTRFVVDALSGTSAGGINAVFLAKALANDLSLDALRQLWVTEGDIDVLLNDRKSLRAMPWGTKLQNPRTSLLNSRRMYFKLLEALNALDAPRDGRTAPPSPYVGELDLFITATDIDGLVLPVPLADKLVYERRHRNVFHFVYATAAASGEERGPGDPQRSDIVRNDLAPGFNPFLAYAARCTSSFPVAFEPMTLDDVRYFPPYRGFDDSRFAEDLASWQRFFRDYLRSGGASDPRTSEQAREEFPRRAFGDGGYLDNKPFSHAIDAIRLRRADAQVDRKLVYVEPSPEHPELKGVRAVRPDVVENLFAAGMALPRYETIREDLERVRARNTIVERVSRATREIDRDLRCGYPEGLPARPALEKWYQQSVDDTTRELGPAYPGYHRLKVARITTEIAELVTRVAGLEEDSQEAVAIRYLVSAWRQRVFTPNRPSGGLKSEYEMLRDYDLSYRLRRLTCVLDRIATLYRLDRHAVELLLPVQRRDSGGNVRPLVLSKDVKAESDEERAFKERTKERFKDAAWARAFQAELRDVRRECNEAIVELRAAGRRLRARDGRSPLASAIADLGIGRKHLHRILAGQTPAERTAFAGSILRDGDRFERFEAAARSLADLLRPTREAVKARFEPRLEPPSDDPETMDPKSAALRPLRNAYRNYLHYDMLQFPMLYGTDVGELDEIEVYRVSPEDATSLVRERDRGGKRLVSKLAGTYAGNFGGFLKEEWRRSDILWGRLDAAERLIGMLMHDADQSDDPEQPPTLADLRARARRSRDLVARAQAAIVTETLARTGNGEGPRILVECLLRTENRNPDRDALIALAGKLARHVQDPGVRAMLEPRMLLDVYRRAFREEQGLGAEVTLRLISRASQILGRMVEGLADRFAAAGKRVAWVLAWFGRILWALVEIAVPRSLGSLLASYWFFLLYGIELVMIGGGNLLKRPDARDLGVQLLIWTAVVDLARRLLGYYLARRGRILRIAALLVAAAGAVLLAMGYVHVREQWPTVVAKVSEAGRAALAAVSRNPRPTLWVAGILLVIWIGSWLAGRLGLVAPRRR